MKEYCRVQVSHVACFLVLAETWRPFQIYFLSFKLQAFGLEFPLKNNRREGCWKAELIMLNNQDFDVYSESLFLNVPSPFPLLKDLQVWRLLT